ncbi:hypothetical protein DV735_g463, partial [Chaetothyriales sp. CBS 134920]
MEGTATTTTTIVPKFSRYLSVRKKNSHAVFDSDGDVQLVASGENQRRKEQTAREEGAHGGVTPAPRPSVDPPSSSPPHDPALSALEAAREEARMILEGEYDRLQMQKKAQQAPDQRRRRNLTLSDQKSRRPEQEDARSAAVSRSRSHRQPPVRRHTPPDFIQPDRPAQAQSSQTRSHGRHHVIGGIGTSSPPRRNPNGPPISHQRDPGPPEIIPLPQVDAPVLNKHTPYKSPEPATDFDAPLSAINAVDRQVTVSCHKSTISLPVIPTTTTADILHRASELMREKMDPCTAILLESFSQLGLERPLRRYERIREVMNGWHNDSQNRLVIMHASECAAVGIELADAPTTKPDGVTVCMYHSSRPGHWAKKWVRLREDGQMCVSSKESFADGSSSNICHLSDFDLYTPTPKQRKALRAPKKICFAVKSQQKSSAFLSGQNFVHFLACNSQDVANDFYSAVWGWRSWYLMDVLGEGTNNNKKLSNGGPHSWRRSLDLSARPFTANSNQNARPLVDLSELRLDAGKADRPISRGGGSLDIRRRPSLRSTSPPRRPTTSGTKAQAHAPPTSFPRKLVLEATNVDHRVEPVSIDDEAFTGKGLLARHASTKSQHGRSTGRGVRGKEGQPLLDLTKESEFVDGSLLRRLEAQKLALGHGHNGGGHDAGDKASVRVDWD